MVSVVGRIIGIGGFRIGVVVVILGVRLGGEWGGEGVFMVFGVVFSFIGGEFMGMGLVGEYMGRM